MSKTKLMQTAFNFFLLILAFSFALGAFFTIMALVMLWGSSQRTTSLPAQIPDIEPEQEAIAIELPYVAIRDENGMEVLDERRIGPIRERVNATPKTSKTNYLPLEINNNGR